MNKSFYKWWVGSGLPDEHIYIKKENRPKSMRKIVRLYYRKWFIHPVKRRVAKIYLAILRKFFGLKVIGITGSAGKTTVKDLITQVLSDAGETESSYKNIDPVYNIPTTILKCRPSTDYLVLEMGVEFPGEMNYYTWIAKPDIGVITNIFPTHLEFFGTQEGVFNEKSNLVKSLGKDKFAVLYADDKYLKKLKGKLKASVVWYGKKGEYNYTSIKRSVEGTSFSLEVGGESHQIDIPLLGEQFVSNAIAAIAVCNNIGLTMDSIKQSLSSIEPTPHRMNVINHKSGAIILDDSYNSNPNALKVSIDTLCDYFPKKKKCVVIGDMLELGEDESRYHKEIAKYVYKKGIRDIITVGNLSEVTAKEFTKLGGKSKHFSKQTGVEKYLATYQKKGWIVLIKGSHSISLDLLVERIT